jgi:penicillin-binding protein 2
VLAGIGQGYVLATPLQIAVMAARVATGREVVPRLVRTEAAPQFPMLPLAADNLDAVRAGLRAGVNGPGGTGSGARPADGTVVAGKTGTSQVRRAADEADAAREVPWEERDHALFLGYFPAEAPRYAVVAVVEHGGGGGATAAPLVKDIIEAILADDPARRSAPVPPVTRAARAHASRGTG